MAPPEDQDPAEMDLITIARIVKPKGLKGEVVADVLTDFPGRFENLESVFVAGQETRELGLEKFYFQKHRIVLKLETVDTQEAAESLRGCEICIEESQAVDLEEDEYFDWELEGCAVVTRDGNRVGIVKELFRAGENINLVVVDGDSEYMIPFVEAICTEVDIEAKRVLVDLPEGLLEF